MPEALSGCLLWDDARAFKSDAIGGRKRKREIFEVWHGFDQPA
ncbi:hypothetical protein [Mesorhizobium sp.]|nr:hypothetical protein [Mesorhizobium sp.]